MKLHPMQIKTLQRVDQGRVYEIRGDGYYQIRNAGRGVLNSLLVLGLIKNKEEIAASNSQTPGALLLRRCGNE